jgi:hypothetical protein
VGIDVDMGGRGEGRVRGLRGGEEGGVGCGDGLVLDVEMGRSEGGEARGLKLLY